MTDTQLIEKFEADVKQYQLLSVLKELGVLTSYSQYQALQRKIKRNAKKYQQLKT